MTRRAESAASGERAAATKQSTPQYQSCPIRMPPLLVGTGRINSLLWQVGNPQRARTWFHPKLMGGSSDFSVTFIGISLEV
jgi:hypothetical protein